jgi:hypothetical protein
VSKLETVINRIKATHAPLAPPADAPTPADDLRAVFAAFPDELQRAMRQAGQAERWTPAQWRDEVGIVEEIRVESGYADDANRIAAGIYREIAGVKKSDGAVTVTAWPPGMPSKASNDHG